MIVGKHWHWLGVGMLSTVMLWGSVARAETLALKPVEVGQPERIEVFPTAIEFTGLRATAQFVVTGVYPGGHVQDLTRVAKIESNNPQVVCVDSTVAQPVGNGQADVIIRVGGVEARVPATVSRQNQSQPVSFHYETLAALSKQGCNSGACHGSPAGKGGFRLSLRAFDPDLDRLTLIREDFGRRTNPIEPAASLLLLKPLTVVSHGGGRRINQDDPAYHVLRDWIAEGCQTDPAGTPECVRLEVFPGSGRVLTRPAHTQQLSVRAHFSDGSVRDVTNLAVYSSSDEEVASVTEGGLVVGKQRGEAAVIVRYLEFIESSSMTFVENVEGYAWKSEPQHNYIDECVDAKLRQLQFVPSGVCRDETFIRRVYLDVIGTLPTVSEVRTFLADDSPDKRARLIDSLLDRPEFAKFWALKWGDLLRLTSNNMGSDGVYKFHRWLHRAVAANMPYDEFARQLLTAQGSTHVNPPANFYRTAGDTSACVETVSQVFLGARLQCAKCHNHPFERWSQDNYYGMAAFFNRVQRKDTSKPEEKFIFVARSGEVTQPRTGQQMKPWLPARGDIDQPNVEDRRRIFADWLTQPDNPYFAKIEVNRIWSYLFSKGIVDPPDDFRDTNPPCNALLLDALAEDFVQSGYDRKHIIRAILNSRTYQSTVATHEFNREDTKYFSHRTPRMLTAEQLLDAICSVTGVAESFGTLPPDTKATHLPAPDLVDSQFLEDFGQPKRKTVCQCERSSESNLGMAIQFYNGPLVHKKLTDPNNRFRRLAAAGKADGEIIRELFLAAYSRPPDEQELALHKEYVIAKQNEIEQRNRAIERRIAHFDAKIADTYSEVKTQLVQANLQAIPEVIRSDVESALATEEGQRSQVQRYLAGKFGPSVRVSEDEIANSLNEHARESIKAAEARIAELRKQQRQPADARQMGLEDVCWALLTSNEFLLQH